jgi:hypothetical protein
MPDGAAIFETSGAWADFSTLSWISVSLIAIDFKISSSGRAAAGPPGDAEGQERRGRQLRNVLASELALRKISHPRIDGLCVDPCG